MPYNGSGVFLRVRNWVNDAAGGIKIRADRHDTEDDNFASGLTQCITKDGQTTVTANLPMATYKHTGVGAATSVTQYTRFDQTLYGKTNWSVAGGTADAITGNHTVPIDSLTDGQLCCVRISSANETTTPTFAPDGLTARTIVRDGGSPLEAGDTGGSGYEIILRYNLTNTRWELLNPKNLIISSIKFENPEDGFYGNILVTTLTGDRTWTLPNKSGFLATTSDLPDAATETVTGIQKRDMLEKGSILYGLTLSNNGTDAAHDIDIEAGAAVASDGTVITLDTGLTKRFDATFAEGGGNGGMASGESLPTSGTIHVWLISKADGTTDVFANNNATSGLSPTLPTDFVNKKRIGSLITDSSANIIAISQMGSEFLLITPVLDASVTNPGTSRVFQACSIPTGLQVGAMTTVGLLDLSADLNYAVVTSPDQSDVSPTASTWDMRKQNSQSLAQNVSKIIRTNTSGQISYRFAVSSASVQSRVLTFGWIDDRKGD